MTTTYDVYVANIHAGVDERKIRDIFGVAGNIFGVKFTSSKKVDGNKICFVKYFKESDAEYAANFLKRYAMEDGTLLTVRYNNNNKSPAIKSYFETPTHQNEIVTPFKLNESKSKSERFLVMVVYVESAIKFYAQKIDQAFVEILQEITEQLSTLCSTQPKVVGQLSMHQVYGSMFAVDGEWYRCCIEKFLPDNMVQVRYIDYGNSEVVERSSLIPLPISLASFPPVASCYCLAGVELVDNENTSELFIKGRETMVNLINDSSIEISTESLENDAVLCTIHSVNTTESGLDVIEKLISTGAVKNKASPVKILNGKSTYPSFSPLNNTIINKKSPMTENLNVSSLVNGERADLLQKQLEKAESEVIALKNKLEGQKLEMEVAMKTAVTSRLQKLFINVQDLRKARGKVAICNELFPAQLQQKVDLVLCSHESINLLQMKHYQTVLTSQSTVKDKNFQISSCIDKEELPSLIEAREKAIKKAICDIKSFLKHVALLPVADRLNKLKNALSELNIDYKEILDSHPTISFLTLQSAVEQYENLMIEKKNKFHELQLFANEKSNKLYKSLSESLRDCHCIVTDVVGDVQNIDVLIQEYEDAIHEEIYGIMALEKSFGECDVLSHVVIALEKTISSEISDIQMLQGTLITRYEELQEKYESILNNKPETSNITKLRKKLKSLKSRHRHLIADVNDVEEDSEENDSTNIKMLEIKIEELRNILHGAFVEELQEMRVLLNFYDDFPELNKLYPELHLHEFKLTNGLLQSSRTIEFYAHSPMPILGTQPKQTTYKAFFNRQPCVIKEIILDDKVVVYSDVLLRIVEYEKQHKNQSWQKIECLFKERGERKLFVHTPFFEEGNLKEFIERRKPSKSVISILLKQILLALQFCEETYGSLKPSNVYIKNEANKYHVVLSEPNIVETLERQMNSCMLIHKFVSGYPVLDVFQEEPSKKSDIVCFAGLALWALYPNGPFSQNIHSDIEVIVENGDLKSLFRKALSLTPNERPTVAEVLSHSFFKNLESEVEIVSESQTRAKKSVILSGEESLITEETSKTKENTDASEELLIELEKKGELIKTQPQDNQDDLNGKTNLNGVSEDSFSSSDFCDSDNDEKNNEAAVEAWSDMLQRKKDSRKALSKNPLKSLIPDDDEF